MCLCLCLSHYAGIDVAHYQYNTGQRWTPSTGITFNINLTITETSQKCNITVTCWSHVLWHSIRCQDCQIPSSVLVDFNGLKQRLEVPCTKALWMKHGLNRLSEWRSLLRDDMQNNVVCISSCWSHLSSSALTWWLCLWMTSKNTVGRSWTGLVKIWSK